MTGKISCSSSVRVARLTAVMCNVIIREHQFTPKCFLQRKSGSLPLSPFDIFAKNMPWGKCWLQKICTNFSSWPLHSV